MAQLPFHTVTARSDELTHLVVTSPALRSSSPDRLPIATLCGRAVDDASDTPVHDVACSRCLVCAPKFMGLPAFEVRL